MVSLKSVLQFPPFRTSGFFWPEYSIRCLQQLLNNLLTTLTVFQYSYLSSPICAFFIVSLHWCLVCHLAVFDVVVENELYSIPAPLENPTKYIRVSAVSKPSFVRACMACSVWFISVSGVELQTTLIPYALRISWTSFRYLFL